MKQKVSFQYFFLKFLQIPLSKKKENQKGPGTDLFPEFLKLKKQAKSKIF